MLIPPCPELSRELRRYKRLQKFFESLEIYQRRWIIEGIRSAKREKTGKHRAVRAAEFLMEVMEAERDLPPAPIAGVLMQEAELLLVLWIQGAPPEDAVC